MFSSRCSRVHADGLLKHAEPRRLKPRPSQSPLPCLVSTGNKFENPEMFGQYPLQVNGFKDLHECLEAAMNEGEMEAAETCSRSGQEVSAPGVSPSPSHTSREL